MGPTCSLTRDSRASMSSGSLTKRKHVVLTKEQKVTVIKRVECDENAAVVVDSFEMACINVQPMQAKGRTHEILSEHVRKRMKENGDFENLKTSTC